MAANILHWYDNVQGWSYATNVQIKDTDMPNTLVVPVVLWGKNAPTHCVSCIYLSRDQKTLITGCYDGQICLWDVDSDSLHMTPRCMLVGHSAPILCLSEASICADHNNIVSSSEVGEMCTWDLVDGKCREHVKLPNVHTNMQAYHMANCDDVRLFCNGYYPEIIVIDPFSLEVLFSLSSKVNPDWISALHVLRPAKRKDDVVLALTTTGTVKVWTLTGTESKASEPIYENESKQIRCLNAICMQCCAYNQRTVLIVCAKYWQIYDAGDFSVLCSVIAPRGERWMSGDFLAPDRVIVWSDAGKGYLYKLPANSVAENKDFHQATIVGDNPFLYCLLTQPDSKPLSCPPAMRFITTRKHGSDFRYLLRGDSEGIIMLWQIPDVTNQQLAQIQQESMGVNNNVKATKPPVQLKASLMVSLDRAWDTVHPSPVGVLDQFDHDDDERVKLTASLYLPQQARLVVGREDGSIIILPATQTVLLQLFHGKHTNYKDWPPHQLLHGHVGRVNCLLYPHGVHSRYDKTHLVSGGVDFAVCLWDLYSGNLLHRFCVHAGEVTQLLVPPSNCSPRIQKCICSVASDHSVCLLGLSERRCVCLASRHLFPVLTIKWRPLDDFLVVGCSDGSVYVWQMDTGHLDRVLNGVLAEEVLYACDENNVSSSSTAGSDMGLANPAIHFFRGLRHRNLSAIRHATQRGLDQLQQLRMHNNPDGSYQQKNRVSPLSIQGLRTNPKDPEGHILFFDVESLVVELLSEEYAAMSPDTLEAAGLIAATEYSKVATLTQSASPDVHKKVADNFVSYVCPQDFFGKVKDKAGDVERKIMERDKHGIIAKLKEGTETMQTRIQAKMEGSKFNADGSRSDSIDLSSKKNKMSITGQLETNHTMEIAQLLLSLLHAWGLDPELDHLCEVKLGLLRPMVPVSFGVLSKGGYMSLILPTWQSHIRIRKEDSEMVRVAPPDPNREPMRAETFHQEVLTRAFTSRAHWELSTTLTSNHLLAIIALSNTLMSMNNATFVAEQERNRKLHRQSTKSSWSKADDDLEEMYSQRQAEIKQGWSRLATLHCVLLPDRVAAAGAEHFKRPLVEMMARRWQHQCVEVREAAQALLLAELRGLGAKGRKNLVDYWSQYLPSQSETQPTQQAAHHVTVTTSSTTATTTNGAQTSGNGTNNGPATATNGSHPVADVTTDEEEFDEEEDEQIARKPKSMAELRRKQTTAIILLGVIGAEFGQDITQERQNGATDVRKNSVVADGYGIMGNTNLARRTAMALAHLLMAPPSKRQPLHTSLRRAAIDLIGRGFTVWEPYLDVSKILLGLLEMCSEADKLVPSMTYGLPLSPPADSCRTARHALTLIATARPAAFITTMAREVARYNTLAQNAQTINVNIANSVLHRAKPEILRCVELLIDKMQSEMSDLLVELMDIILHCVDPGHLKTKGLADVFPAVCRFSQVSHCTTTRRIAVGGHNGNLAIYDLRSSKYQMLPAHSSPITACTFSPDGKYLCSYACNENRLSFWQTSTGMFGLGASQTRCVKSYSTAPVADVARLNPIKLARLIWINNRTVTLMLADGSETRFNV